MTLGSAFCDAARAGDTFHRGSFAFARAIGNVEKRNLAQRPRKLCAVHELSLAVNIVDAVNELAQAHGFERVEAVTVQIGEFAGVDKGALSFAWDLATADSVAAGSRLEFRDVRLKVRCPACGVERNPPSMWELGCSTCPAVAPEILAGRELHVVSLEVPN